MPLLMRLMRWIAPALVFAAALVGGGIAFAGLGQPSPWQMGLQQAVTPSMEDIVWFHDLLLYIITGITIFVLVLLLIVILKFNARANPVPSKTTHNTLLEILWTVIPVVILVVIAIPSFRILFVQLNLPPADVTVKATGKQWYWSYSYPDNGKFEFDSLLVQDKDLKPDQPRLLAVDNEVIVPVGQVIRLQTIGNDVIHSWAMPSFGVKLDAVPGRLNEIWFRVDQEGVYYGQCSELCGQAPAADDNDLHGHAFMPIVVRAVAPDKFAAWAKAAASDLDGAYKLLAEDASSPAADVKVAAK